MSSAAIQIKSVRTAVLDVAYEEHGPLGGDVVVLLHGFPYDPRCFDLIAPTSQLNGSFREVNPSAARHIEFIQPTEMCDCKMSFTARDRLIGLSEA